MSKSSQRKSSKRILPVVLGITVMTGGLGLPLAQVAKADFTMVQPLGNPGPSSVAASPYIMSINDPALENARALTEHNGDLYVAVRDTDSINRVNPVTGEITIAVQLAQYDNPMTVAFNSAGDLFYTLDSDVNIYKISAATLAGATGPVDATVNGVVSVHYTATDFNYIYGLAFDSSDNLYFLNNMQRGAAPKGIYQLAPTATQAVQVVSEYTDFIYGIAFDGEGNLLAGTNDGRIVKIASNDLNGLTPTGNYQEFGQEYVNGLTFMPDGTMFITIDGAPYLKQYVPDVSAPVMEAGYPNVAKTTAYSASIALKADEESMFNYVALPAGSPAPTVQQIMDGLDADGNDVSGLHRGYIYLNATEEAVMTVPGLNPVSSYDIYMVGQDWKDHIQAQPTKLTITTPAEPTAVNNWTHVGPNSLYDGDFIEPSLAVNNDNGQLFAAFRANNTENESIYVKTFDGQNWVTLGDGPVILDGKYPSLAIDNGIPYLAFVDSDDNNKLSVKKFENNQWTYVGSQGFSTGFASEINLKMHNGVPYVAFVDNEDNFAAKVYTFDGTSWAIVGPGPSNYDSTLSLAFYQDTPYLLSSDSWGAVNLRTFDGTDWNLVEGFPAVLGGGSSTAMAVSGDSLYVAFSNADQEYRVSILKLQNGQWSTLADDVSSEDTYYMRLAAGNDGSVYVMYSASEDDYHAIVKRVAADGTSTILGNDELSGSYTSYLSMAAYGDTLYTGYVEEYNDGDTYVGTVAKFVDQPVSSGGSDDSETPSVTPELPPVIAIPSDDDAKVLVNGKEESAGKVKNEKKGDKQYATISLDHQKLQEKLDNEGSRAVITIPFSSQADVHAGELNGQMVKSMEQKDAVLHLQTDGANYTLPAKRINIEAVSKAIGENVGLQDITVRVQIAKPTAEMAQTMQQSAVKNQYTAVSDPVDFTITASYGDKTVDVSAFDAYVERTIALPDGIDPNKITTGVVVESDGSVRHVPTKVTVNNGRYYATINSLTNSAYSVVWHPIEFGDVTSHWAKDAVNDMGSRMVIDGKAEGVFAPNDNVTRAEFAAMMVRALGLKVSNAPSTFSDVSANDWYNGAVQTAFEYGLVHGTSDTTFEPNATITREQAFTMISNAMGVTGLSAQVQSGLESMLAPYSDSGKVADWAKDSIMGVLQTGIVSGRSSDVLAPKSELSRAEAATIIKRLLSKSNLI